MSEHLFYVHKCSPPPVCVSARRAGCRTCWRPRLWLCPSRTDSWPSTESSGPRPRPRYHRHQQLRPAAPPSSSSPAVSTSILSLSLSLFQASKLGALLKEAERRCEQQGAELSAQVLEVQRSRADLEELLQHNGRLQQDSEEHQVLRGAYNALLNRSEGGVTAAAATYQLQYTHHTTVPLVFECNTFFHFQCNRSIALSNI